jgi:hypothetical protein
LLVAHACNPRFLGGWDQDYGFRPVQVNSTQDNQTKMDLRNRGSLVCMLKNPEFKSQTHQKKKQQSVCF